MSSKKLMFESQTNTVDLATGEVVEITSTNVFRIPSEPPYVKLYIEDLCLLTNVPEALKKLLLMMLQKLGYDGYITLSTRARKEMAKSLGWTDQTFRNKLVELAKKGLIIRHSQNEYIANPQYFARGEWKAICAQRKAFQLKITYSEKGRKISTESVAQQDELPFD